MAAPLVSGAVGLVLEHMPNLSPRQAATRLKETASYDGLTASNGCTITTCSEADMAAIFGQGLIDLDAALQPIGNASLVNNSGQYFNGETSYITTPQLVGDAIKRGLEGAVGIARDSFDGAAFAVELTPHINTAPLSSTPSPAFPTSPILAGEDQWSAVMVTSPLGLFLSPSRDAPPPRDLPARLIDVPSQGADTWHGVDWDGSDHGMAGLSSRVMIGQGDQRSAAHFIIASADDHGQKQRWMGMGIDRSHHWLDGETNGVFGDGGSRSTWLFAGHHFKIGTLDITVEGLMGQTRLDHRSSDLIQAAQLTFDSWSLRLDHQVTHHAMPWQWGIRLHQPPALRQGHLVLNEPIGFDGTGINFAPKRYDLSLSAREKQAGLFGQATLLKGVILSAELQHISHYGHQKNRDVIGFSAKATHRF